MPVAVGALGGGLTEEDDRAQEFVGLLLGEPDVEPQLVPVIRQSDALPFGHIRIRRDDQEPPVPRVEQWRPHIMSSDGRILTSHKKCKRGDFRQNYDRNVYPLL